MLKKGRESGKKPTGSHLPCGGQTVEQGVTLWKIASSSLTNEWPGRGTPVWERKKSHPCGKWLRWFTAMVSRLPHGSQLGGDGTGREGTGRTAWPLLRMVAAIHTSAGTDQRRGPGRGEELTVFPVEKTAVLILFGPLLT